MSNFLKFQNRYINLDHVIEVEMEATGEDCFDINIHLANSKNSFIQLRTKEREVANKMFEEIGKVLGTKELINLDAIKLNCLSSSKNGYAITIK